MSTQTTNQELSLEEKKVLLKPVAKAIESKHEYISRALDEHICSLFAEDDEGQPAFMYSLFMKSLLLLMTIPENSAFMKKDFGGDTLACFNKLLFFFESLEEEPVGQWVDYAMCVQFCGGINSDDIERLRNKYLKEKS